MKGLSIFACLVACVLYGCSSEQKQSAKLDPYEEAEELGLEVNFDVLKNRVVAPEDDAAPLYALYEPTYSEELYDSILEYVGSNNNRHIIENLVSKIDYDPIELITARPDYLEVIDWDYIVRHHFVDQYRKTKEMSVLLCARASVRASNGDVDGTVEDIERLVNLDRQLKHSSTMIGQLRRRAQMHALSKTLTKIARSLSSQPDDLERVSKVLIGLEEPSDRHYLQFEPAMALSLLGMIERGEASLRELSSGKETVSRDPMEIELFKNNSEEIRRKVVSKHLEFARVWNDFEKLKQLSDEFANDDSIPTNLIDIAVNEFNKIMIYSMYQTRTMELDHQAMVRGIKIGIASTILKARTGERPTLQEAASAAGVSSKDPFGGELQFSHYSLPFIYSVRDDGDQGGKLRSETYGAFDTICFGKID